MVRELAGEVSPADPAESNGPAATAKSAAPLIDRTLQRAVQVHRGLAALKRFRG